MEISRWRKPPVGLIVLASPGGAMEDCLYVTSQISSAPPGLVDLDVITGGLRHRLISGGPPGLTGFLRWFSPFCRGL